MPEARHRAPEAAEVDLIAVVKAESAAAKRHAQAAYRWALAAIGAATLCAVVAISAFTLDVWP